MEALYAPLILGVIQDWQKPGQTLHLALDTTMLWNRYCVVVLSVVAHGRAIPLQWHTLEHSSASVNAEISIALLEKADRLLAGFANITLLADRAFPCGELRPGSATGPVGATSWACKATRSFLRMGLATLQAFITKAKAKRMPWQPIPEQDLELCIPSRGVIRRRKHPWFTQIEQIELPPRSKAHHRPEPAVA